MSGQQIQGADGTSGTKDFIDILLHMYAIKYSISKFNIVL